MGYQVTFVKGLASLRNTKQDRSFQVTSGPRLCVHAKFQSRTVSAVSRRVFYFPPKITLRVKGCCHEQAMRGRRPTHRQWVSVKAVMENKRKFQLQSLELWENPRKLGFLLLFSLPCSIMSSHDNMPSLIAVLSLKTSFLYPRQMQETGSKRTLSPLKVTLELAQHPPANATLATELCSEDIAVCAAQCGRHGPPVTTSTGNVASATEGLNFSFYFIFVTLNISSHMWLVSPVLGRAAVMALKYRCPFSPDPSRSPI